MARKKLAAGEMGVAAESNGRVMTLDPIETLTISVPVRQVESTIPCGFRQPWMSAESEEGEEVFSMAVGAGCGSRWLTFDYKGKQYCIDGEELAKSLMETVDGK